MPSKKISPNKLSGILELYALKGVNKTFISRSLKISRGTVIKYTKAYDKSDFTYTDILLDEKKVISFLISENNKSNNSFNKPNILKMYSKVHTELNQGNSTLKSIWNNYKRNNPSGYSYSHFTYKYRKWCNANTIKPYKQNKWFIKNISKLEKKLLQKLKHSNDKKISDKATVILELNNGVRLTTLSKKINRAVISLKRWFKIYNEFGLEKLIEKKPKVIPDAVTKQIKIKSEQVVKLLHEPPSIHNINRTSWSLKSLSKAYKNQYGEYISTSTISRYIHEQGYSFKKARTVLTSPDPDYRKKLNKIKKVLSNLNKNEKFLSIDEFGPVAIKVRGGRTYTEKETLKTIPQFQVSKGSLICTAALELSTNQVTHFYSTHKNTKEMIKLLTILLKKYKDENKIYFSWDAASWHASKELEKKVDEVNSDNFRLDNHTPLVELVPLPSSAQFLNVIESVFSGMARAIIHNSNYTSVDECKSVIDRYFLERNNDFIANPKKAGKKIWGEEKVIPIFKESNNCKDINYR